MVFGKQRAFHLLKKGSFKKAQTIIETLSDVNCVDKEGYALLARASQLGAFEIANGLIKKGADINAKALGTQNDFYLSPLYLAIYCNHLDIAGLLLQEGAEVDCIDIKDRTPLHIACKYGNVKAADLLLSYGADVNAANIWGAGPIHNACSANRQSLVLLLHRYQAPLDQTDGKGHTPLYYALTANNFVTVKFLLNHGVSVDECSGLYRQNTLTLCFFEERSRVNRFFNSGRSQYKIKR